MKRSLLLAGLGILAGFPSAARPHKGKAAPDFSVTTLDGHTLTAKFLRGKVVLVNFWATWCAPCRAEMPAFDAYYKAHKADGLEIIAISQDDKGLSTKVAAVAAGFTFPVALADKADVDDFGRLWTLPTTFIIDRGGVLQFDGSDKATVFTPVLLDQLVTPLLKPPAGQTA